MTSIKKLVMHGFKSFVRKTEVPFTEGINVVLGPNGSGKSNISDALCFVLGRLSIKSMRAAKAKNLIFMGSKVAGPAKEAIVEIIFDNTDKTFQFDSNEVSIKRILRRNGQSIYKINNETKTRQEIIALLAQAGIDPNGFNIILQGEIQNFVRMQNEERRKVIEEVSGISVYEMRKERSLKELEKTEEKLKEVSAILRERTAYLNNLEKEREQALKFKKLEKDVRIFKKSILYYDLTKKKNQLSFVLENIEKNSQEIEKTKKIIISLKTAISTFETKIENINSTIQKETGLEQEQLNQEIANIRADLAVLNVNKENVQRKLSSIERQKQELSVSLKENQESLEELHKESPTIARKQKEIEKKKKELEDLEIQLKKYYEVRSEIRSTRDRLQDKVSLFNNYKNESGFLLKQIDALSLEIFDKHSNTEKLNNLKNLLEQKNVFLEELNKKEIELEKIAHTNEYEIERQNKVIEQISKIDVCPTCKSKITSDHICSIKEEISPKINKLKEGISQSDRELNELYQKREIIKKDLEQIKIEVSKRQTDLFKISEINKLTLQVKAIQEKESILEKEIIELKKRYKSLETNFDENSHLEQRCETARVELQTISLRSEENVNSEITFKQRDLDRMKIDIKQMERSKEDLSEELKGIENNIKLRQELLEAKRKQDEELIKKYNRLLGERDAFHKKIREEENKLSLENNNVHNFEQKINDFKIDKARFDAEIGNLEIELLEFSEEEPIKSPNRDSLVERLQKTQEILSRIGSVNLKSLEVYDSIKEEYEQVKFKVETIEKEKESVLKIISEIDIKKKKTFIRTFEALNEIFSNNFAQISTKGTVSLEMENKKDPFEGGVGIVVKTGHGKYFDVTSLSGGEQTMVALSLIFAIQELKPYCFYILDEIDAALDKRNSSRLAGLLQKYMKKGQYIVITHNDEVISNATCLYGVSMHDGISKITSLKV